MAKAQVIRLATAGAGIVLMLVGILTRSWWSIEISGMGGAFGGGMDGLTIDAEMHAGLRSVEACLNGMCQTAEWSKVPANVGTVFRMCASVTFFGGIAACILLAVGVFVRETQGVEQVARWGSTLCGVIAPFVVMAALTAPSGGSHPLVEVDTSVGYSFFACILGVIAGAVAGRMGLSSGWGEGTGKYIPLNQQRPSIENMPSVYPGAAAQAHPAAAPAAAPAAGNKPAMQSYDYDAKIRDATSTPPPTTRLKDLGRPKGASTTANAATDSMRTTLRFVARSVEIMSGAGISVVMEDGSVRDILWSQVGRVVARRLPPDPPYDKTLFVDIVPTVAPLTPVRMLPSTQANYGALPGGAAMSSTENLRVLGKVIAEARPGVVEPHSEGFFLAQQQPAQFQAIKQFADYDAQYTG